MNMISMFLKHKATCILAHILHLRESWGCNLIWFEWAMLVTTILAADREKIYAYNKNNSQCDPAYAGYGEIRV